MRLKPILSALFIILFFKFRVRNAAWKKTTRIWKSYALVVIFILKLQNLRVNGKQMLNRKTNTEPIAFKMKPENTVTPINMKYGLFWEIDCNRTLFSFIYKNARNNPMITIKPTTNWRGFTTLKVKNFFFKVYSESTLSRISKKLTQQ